ncbi:MAG: endopeptidase nlpc/p60 domain [Verrucomicrobiaceae bacterium]|nr:endopeptidase nlpc/p60 domain [Verrucomicrobiaceae bacterium]
MPVLRCAILACFTLLLVQCGSSGPKTWTYNFKDGKTSLLLNNQAVPQANIPHKVQLAVAAGNKIHGKPYRYGGGHAHFEDKGYDCSGTVSYVLHEAGLLNEATTSGELRRFGKNGEGKWMTVYAKDGHAFIVVAGLRLDTSNGGGRDVGPRWTTKSRTLQGFRARHPEGL